jgi:hypothetical protein
MESRIRYLLVHLLTEIQQLTASVEEEMESRVR